MGSITTEILFILLLIIANGVFALAEVAVVASRKARLQQRAQDGDVKARAALELVESPNRFLATVQIGITLVGIFAGAFGGATLSKTLAATLRTFPLLETSADSLALGIVVIAITYLSLVIGELAPKRIGMHSPERIATLVAVPMRALSFIASPFVSILSVSTDLVLRLVGLRASEEPPVSQEEIQVMMDQGRQAGVFEEAEQNMVQRVFRLGDRATRSLMTNRPEIVWLDTKDSWEENCRKLARCVYSRVPVCRGSLDEVLGFLRAKDLLNGFLAGKQPDLTTGLHPPVFVPENLAAFKLLESFKTHRTHLLFVIDEHGMVQGLVTLQDVFGAVVGDLPSVDESDKPSAVRRADGSWLLDGLLAIDEFEEIFRIDDLPGEGTGNYHTLSGFIMMHLSRIPATGDRFELSGLQFEILDMDGHRIDKVLVSRVMEDNKSA
jgi:putative hemolysin